MKKAKLFQKKKNYAELSAFILQIQFLKTQEDASNIRNNHDPVLGAINTFQNHPSVVNIKENLT